MNAALRRLVASRAAGFCEYCQIHQIDDSFLTFHIEHIVPRKHGGSDVQDNLALACHHCNFHKGANLTGIDPKTKRIVCLFNPRKDQWYRHFKWRSAMLTGKTMIGRATIVVLTVNHTDRLELRRGLIRRGLFPPRRRFLGE